MVGSVNARTLDYFALLVGAGIVALFSALVATLCIKFEERGAAWFWAALFFGSALVAAYCLGRCCEERNLYLPRSSRATLEKMNPSLKRSIMQVQTLVCSRRP
jgi:hypothetical protein